MSVDTPPANVRAVLNAQFLEQVQTWVRQSCDHAPGATYRTPTEVLRRMVDKDPRPCKGDAYHVHGWFRRHPGDYFPDCWTCADFALPGDQPAGFANPTDRKCLGHLGVQFLLDSREVTP